eukprot:Skav223400  [mRNA]  locus=scaffold2634:580151:587167:- [translate_table: standard]
MADMAEVKPNTVSYNSATGNSHSATEIFSSWMKAKKITSRIEDFAPAEWFNIRDFKADPLKQQAAELRAHKASVRSFNAMN